MNDMIFIDPNKILLWMQKALDEYCTDEFIDKEVKLNINDSIESILKILDWDRWDWILFIVAFEVEFKVEFPDKWIDVLDISLGEFLSKLTSLKNQPKASWGLQKIRILGYLPIIAEEEKAKKDESDLTQYEDNLN